MIEFLKMSGAGNDFVIIDARENDVELSTCQISKICDRSNVGCDQFIVLKDSKLADVLMEIYNPDGSVSGACGNATRCVASLLMKEKNVSEVNIKTASGILNSWKEGELIAVNMGQPKFDWQQIPLSQEKNTEDFVVNDFSQYRFSAVNMGNPHIVTFIDEDLSDAVFFRDGSALEVNPLFTTKTNVEFAKIISSNHIQVRVWERGAGETLACGSGACAVAVAAIGRNLVPKQKLKISFKGGDLFIDWRQDGCVIMIGGFTKIFSGVLDADFLNKYII
jgi:diaminopimelate epimerase